MPKRRDKNKIKEVAKVYTRNGLNMAEALKTVEGNKVYEHDNSIYVKASRWRLDEDLQAEIRRNIEKFDKTLINENFVLMGLYEVINDKTAKHSDRVNAYGLIAKILQLTRESGNHNINVLGIERLNEIMSSVKRMPDKQEAQADNNPMLTTTSDDNIA